MQELLSFQHIHIQNPRLQIEHPEAQCEEWFDQPWDELVAAHLRLDINKGTCTPQKGHLAVVKFQQVKAMPNDFITQIIFCCDLHPSSL